MKLNAVRCIIHFSILVFAFGACAPFANDCPPREDDPDGYLQAICVYLTEEGIDVSPGHPAEYKILRTEESTQGGRQVIIVYLDCCFMGDRAIIDRESGEVLQFDLGPK